jgi:hypothetical protein
MKGGESFDIVDDGYSAPPPPSVPTEPRIRLDMFLLLVLAVAGVHAVAVLLVGIDRLPLDFHSFRQTQTALSIYWILHGGPWIAYETPVLGAPWSIPFEFPVYQLITAAIASLGVPLEIAARIVGYGFFIALLWPLRIILRELAFGRFAYISTAIMLLTSPIYLYWSSTILIESCALFFALLWLALITRWHRRRTWLLAAGSVAAGTLAILAKSTTFLGFGLVACLIVAFFFLQSLRSGMPLASNLFDLGKAVCLLAIPFAAGVVWVAFSDHVKEANEYGRFLTSASLAHWNFGTLQQRLSADLWIGTVANRAIPDALGSFWPVVIAALAFCLTTARSSLVVVAMMVGFFGPFLVLLLSKRQCCVFDRSHGGQPGANCGDAPIGARRGNSPWDRRGSAPPFPRPVRAAAHALAKIVGCRLRKSPAQKRDPSRVSSLSAMIGPRRSRTWRSAKRWSSPLGPMRRLWPVLSPIRNISLALSRWEESSIAATSCRNIGQHPKSLHSWPDAACAENLADASCWRRSKKHLDDRLAALSVRVAWPMAMTQVHRSITSNPMRGKCRCTVPTLSSLRRRTIRMSSIARSSPAIGSRP